MAKAELKIYEGQKSACFSAKKFFFMLIVFLCVFVFKAPAFSQSTITVVGRGTTKEDALQDALRSAVEKATGVFVYSVTEVENFKVVKDKVVAASKGYVKDYKITDEKNYENLIVLTVDVTVDVESIKNIIRENIKAVTYDDVLKDYALITQKMDRLKKSAELLKAITSRPATEMYSFDYVGYDIEDVGLEKARGYVILKISLNSFFWNTYEKILQSIEDPSEKGRADTGIAQLAGNVSYEWHRAGYDGDDVGNGIAFVSKAYAIHPDLEAFSKLLMKVVKIQFVFPNKSTLAELEAKLYGNAIDSDGVRDSDSPQAFEKNRGVVYSLCSFSDYDVRLRGKGWDSACFNNMCISGFRCNDYNPALGLYRGFHGLGYVFNRDIFLRVDFSIENPDLIKNFNKIGVKVVQISEQDY